MNLPRVALALAFGLLVANGVRADNLLNVIVFDGAAAVKKSLGIGA